MNASASPYDLKPWQQQYGQSIPEHLPPPVHGSIAAMAVQAANQFARQTAFTTVMPNGMYGSLTYAQVDEMSDAFARYLRGVLGLAAGDRVALQMPNCLSYPVALLGVLKAGCVAVNTNPLYTATEMAHQFRDSGAKAIVIVDMFADKLAEILPQTDIRHVVFTRVPEFFPPVVRQIVYAVMKYWNRLIPAHGVKGVALPEALALGRAVAKPAQPYWHALTHDDLALLQYTGGTTGVAKGAMLTHGNLLWNVEQMLGMSGSHIDRGSEVVLTALPLYHIFAFTVNFLSMYRMGARNILVPSPRPIQNLQRAMENYRITWLTGVNTLYNALLNEEWFHAYPPKHIKAAGGGGAAMHHAVVQRWEQMVGCPLVEGYGLTESSPVVCFQPLEGARRHNTIGIPAPMTEVRLVDDDGHDVPMGQPGELIVRGPQVMKGYWQRPEESAKVIRDGWLYTGDVAVMDEHGTFAIVDRKKDMILVSGFNVYPNEIEDALTAHEKVMEAAVIGVPDEKTGEAVWAYVVKRDDDLTEAELLAHCRGVLTGYKMPARVVFRDDLPKTPIGKILRRELRTQVLAARKQEA
ncbi:AMP-binding protein [Aquabacterium fontiphilum]|jgi:long-chain acyl-CoA synthetase|uniref:AMP-binding protein n=1 Tax=Aquabacterium fontiphilum TaxID=450365 RepID=UPI001377A74A|nr:AMP-binding protein [Aquabacterium fontiphilum]NBD20378.1 AMP-binding protein [Aquabacterium fontiphilum]